MSEVITADMGKDMVFLIYRDSSINRTLKILYYSRNRSSNQGFSQKASAREGLQCARRSSGSRSLCSSRWAGGPCQPRRQNTGVLNADNTHLTREYNPNPK